MTWTRAHDKLGIAFAQLHRRSSAPKSAWWINRRWGVVRIDQLTDAQARHGCRQLNAWRHALSPLPSPPHQETTNEDRRMDRR